MALGENKENFERSNHSKASAATPSLDSSSYLQKNSSSITIEDSPRSLQIPIRSPLRSDSAINTCELHASSSDPSLAHNVYADRGGRRQAVESPDQGLGSSDNGGGTSSSLERLIGRDRQVLESSVTCNEPREFNKLTCYSAN